LGKKDFDIPHPKLPPKKIKQKLAAKEVKKVPAVEKVLPVEHQKKYTIEKLTTESPAAATQKNNTPTATERKKIQKEKDGALQPGTLQTAYPRYNENTPPPYPRLARKRGQEGTTILQVLVNKEGGVDDLKVIVSSNFSLLDRAALKAVRKWSFEPGRKGTERISMWVKVPVTFKLKK
jgi:protein TonB